MPVGAVGDVFQMQGCVPTVLGAIVFVRNGAQEWVHRTYAVSAECPEERP
jgi:hypothetical protein